MKKPLHYLLNGMFLFAVTLLAYSSIMKARNYQSLTIQEHGNNPSLN